MMKWISVMALTILFCSCTDAKPENAQKEPPVDYYQDDTAFRVESKPVTHPVADVIVISVHKERSHSIVISSSIKKIDSLLDNEQYVYERNDIYLRKIVISQRAIRVLTDYLYNINCITYSRSDAYIYTSYVIDTYNEAANRKKCVYFLPKDILNLFSGLKAHLNQSKNKRDFKNINKLLDEFIETAEKESKIADGPCVEGYISEPM